MCRKFPNVVFEAVERACPTGLHIVRLTGLKLLMRQYDFGRPAPIMKFHSNQRRPVPLSLRPVRLPSKDESFQGNDFSVYAADIAFGPLVTPEPGSPAPPWPHIQLTTVRHAVLGRPPLGEHRRIGPRPKQHPRRRGKKPPQGHDPVCGSAASGSWLIAQSFSLLVPEAHGHSPTGRRTALPSKPDNARTTSTPPLNAQRASDNDATARPSCA